MPKKLNNHKSGAAVARKARLHAEAVERSIARDNREWWEQLVLIAARPGNSKREIARIGAKLDREYTCVS